MKTEQEIRERLAEISTKIDRLYHEVKCGNVSERDCDYILSVLQTREDMLEWVLEEVQDDTEPV